MYFFSAFVCVRYGRLDPSRTSLFHSNMYKINAEYLMTLKHVTAMSIKLRFWLARTKRVKKSCQSIVSHFIVFAHQDVNQSHMFKSLIPSKISRAFSLSSHPPLKCEHAKNGY